MKRNFELTFAAILIVGVAALNGCTESSAPEAAKSNANQTTVATANNANQSTANLSVSNAAAVNSPNASTPIVAAGPTAAPIDKKNAPATAVKAPSPVVGSGGNDLFLFSQVRTALSADNDLLNAVIVDIKEGNVTLTGNVRSEVQKNKAAQLIQNVKGIKSVKNNLRVSS